jgi:phosphatidylethanolamine-binding protein (PEBP) family uncharacterized protein
LFLDNTDILNFTHWVLYNIPANVREIEEHTAILRRRHYGCSGSQVE